MLGEFLVGVGRILTVLLMEGVGRRESEVLDDISSCCGLEPLMAGLLDGVLRIENKVDELCPLPPGVIRMEELPSSFAIGVAVPLEVAWL